MILVDNGDVVVFSIKHWDHRNSQALIESVTPCDDAQRCWLDLSPVCSGYKVSG